ncbi:ATP-grasp domain-containing protein [Pseudactinotalea sp. Z1732]
MVPILCHRRGLPTASLDAVVRLEHKYWNRLIQARVIDALPAFGLLDLEAEPPHLPQGVDYPAWIKPAMSASSEGAYHVEDADQLAEAIPSAREDVVRMGRPFEDILAMLDLPAEIEQIGGAVYMAEEEATGRQMTVEGFIHNQQAHIYGLVDSTSYPGSASFQRYTYPSSEPDRVVEQVADASREVIQASGLDNSTFNIEFFWDPGTSRLRLLEVNARHSQAHATLFEMVDGVPNHAAMVALGLGRRPHIPDDKGPYPVAAKWFLRHFADGVVRRVPTAEQIAQFEQRVPGTKVDVVVTEGSRLSDGYFEDSYSFALAEVITAGTDDADLQRKYDEFLQALPFEIDDDEEA